MEKEVIFVILHYIAIDDTLKCIDSIKENIDTGSFYIIVVDNASPDGSGTKLAKLFADDPDVKVELSSENLGFARGNNIGYGIARKMQPRFIIMLNNDIILLEKAFYKKLTVEYETRPFAVLGPMILTADGRYDSNPTRSRLITKKEVLDSISYSQKLLFLSRFRLDRAYLFYLSAIKHNLYLLYASLRSRVTGRKKIIPEAAKRFCERQEDVELHGCFWVFSPLYNENLDGLDSRTFMYSEEMILAYHMARLNMKMVYFPDIVVYHAEAASTAKISKSSLDRRRFLYKSRIDSLNVLLDVVLASPKTSADP